MFEGPKRLKTAANPEQAQVTNPEGEASDPAASAILASNNKRQSQLFVTEDEPDDEAAGKGMYPWLVFLVKADILTGADSATTDTKPAPEAAKPLAEPSGQNVSTSDAEPIAGEMDVSPGSDTAVESGDDSQHRTTETDSSTMMGIAPYRSTHPNVLKEKQLRLLRDLPDGFPQLACFLPIFKEAEELVTWICEQFIEEVKQLKDEGYHNEEIDIVCDDLETCRYPPDKYASVGPVACLGTTGKGKTSCISSILDEDEAEFASGGTKRGTYVSHEYHGATSSQICDSLVKIFYLSNEGMQKQAKKFLSDILRRLTSKPGEDSEDESESEDEDESDLIDAKHGTAVECLDDVLCGDRRFEKPRSIEEFCRTKMKKTAKDRGLDAIFKAVWPAIEAMMAGRQKDDDIETIKGTDGNALHQKLKRLTTGAMRVRGADGRIPSPWPFISKVQVHRTNRFLDAGLTLADTPGSGDHNQHVIENTNRSLKEAGTIMIVTQYLRFDNDETLQHHLKTCIRLGKMHNIILVLTKIDEMKLLDEDEKSALSREDADVLEAAEHRLKALQKKVDETKREKEAARGNADRFMKLDDELHRLEASEIEADCQLKQAHIQLRCRELRCQAARLLRDVENSKYAPKLKAFPVSNTQYQLHVRGGKERPFLDLEATGVPELRRELLGISSGGKFNTLQHLCTRQLPWIFAGIEGILTKTPSERTGQLRKVLVRMMRQESDIFTKMKADLLWAYDDNVTSTIHDNTPRWGQACKAMIEDQWAGIHGSTLAAILGRSGKWKHKKLRKTFNLSRDIHNIFLSKKKIFVAFDNFMEYFLSMVAKAFNLRLKSKLDGLRRELTEGQYSKGLRMGPFSKYIMGTYAHIERSMEGQFDKLETEIESIRHSFTLEPENDDYGEKQDADGEKYQHIVGRAMKETYKDAKTQDMRGLKGKAVKKARLAILEAKLTSRDKEKNLFHCIGKVGRDRLEAFFDKWAEASSEIVDAGFAKIQENFDASFRERTAIKTEDQPEAEEKLKRMVAEAESVINGRLKELIETCQDFEKADMKA